MVAMCCVSSFVCYMWILFAGGLVCCFLWVLGCYDCVFVLVWVCLVVVLLWFCGYVIVLCFCLVLRFGDLFAMF